MAKREFQKSSIDKLEALVREKAQDHDLLKRILEELNYRSTNRAEKLKTRIAQSIKSSSRRSHRDGSHYQTGSGATFDDELRWLNEERGRLSRRVKELEGTIAALRQELDNTRRRAAQAEASGADSDFSRVGLSENSPEFVIRSVRKAFQKTYHPDVCGDLAPDAAHKRYIEFEQIFERIFHLKGLR